MCRQLQIPVEYLHNAGNDAHVSVIHLVHYCELIDSLKFTMQATRAMATGEDCDKQRERRWPNRSSAVEPKLIMKPEDEDEEYSDMEGLFPPPGKQFPVNHVEYDDEDDEELM